MSKPPSRIIIMGISGKSGAKPINSLVFVILDEFEIRLI